VCRIKSHSSCRRFTCGSSPWQLGCESPFCPVYPGCIYYPPISHLVVILNIRLNVAASQACVQVTLILHNDPKAQNFITEHCYDCSILCLVIVNLLVCLIYTIKLSMQICIGKKPYCMVISKSSDVYWRVL
jgi:hypothetical protein